MYALAVAQAITADPGSAVSSPPGILGGIAGVILALAALVGAMQQRSRKRRSNAESAADADPPPGPPVLDVDPAVVLLIDDLRAQIGDLRRKVEACETRDRRNATRFAALQERDRIRKSEVSDLRSEVSRLRTILADRESR